MSCAQLSGGGAGFKVVYPLACGLGSPESLQPCSNMAGKLFSSPLIIQVKWEVRYACET